MIPDSSDPDSIPTNINKDPAIFSPDAIDKNSEDTAATEILFCDSLKTTNLSDSDSNVSSIPTSLVQTDVFGFNTNDISLFEIENIKPISETTHLNLQIKSNENLSKGETFDFGNTVLGINTNIFEDS